MTLDKTRPRRTALIAGGVSSPSRRSAFPTCFASSSTSCDSWIGFAPFHRLISMLRPLMFRLRRIQDQVLWSIVIAPLIAVMHMFLRVKQAPNQPLHHQPMLQHVAIARRGCWMVGSVDVDVAGFVRPASALPLVAVGAAIGVSVAAQIRDRLAFLVPSTEAIPGRNRRWLSTSTSAGTTRGFWVCHIANLQHMGRNRKYTPK